MSSDGSVLAVGAIDNYGSSSSASDNGHVRVYKYLNDAWTQLGTDIDGEAAGDLFGWSVSLSSDGGVLAVGAIENDGNSGSTYDHRGHVRVYQYNVTDNAWTQLGADIDGEAAGDLSGWSVSLSSDGGVLAVGAIYNDGNSGSTSDNRGHVRVYQYNVSSNAWTQLGADIDGEAAGDLSGWSVSLSSDGSVLAVGATDNDECTTGIESVNPGRVRVYKFNVSNSAWTQLGADIYGESSGDFSGYAVSLSSDGSVLAVGAIFNDGSSGSTSDNRGHVRIFQASPITSPQSTQPTSQPEPSFQSTSEPTSSQPSFQPTPQPTDNPTHQPTSHPTTSEPLFQPSFQQTSQPTDNPTFDVNLISLGLPFVGDCPSQVSVAGGGVTVHYEPGERVSNHGVVFECKNWPDSLYCAQAAFKPDLDSKLVFWKQAWAVIGYCTGTAAVTTSGVICPNTWTSGDVTKYKENDRVSVIKSISPLIQVMYKCKAWPYSWHCGQFSPLDSTGGGKLGWDYVGECSPAGSLISTPGSAPAPVMTPTDSPIFVALPFVAGGCPAEFSESAYYEPGDRVSKDAVVFECKNWPDSLYCTQAAFKPELNLNTEHWEQAWNVVGHCTGTAAVTTTGDICPNAWTSGDVTKYKENDRVSVIKSISPLVKVMYKCKAWPYSWHCGQFSPLDLAGGGKLGWDYVGGCV